MISEILLVILARNAHFGLREITTCIRNQGNKVDNAITMFLIQKISESGTLSVDSGNDSRDS
jgi:hypothetical protein